MVGVVVVLSVGATVLAFTLGVSPPPAAPQAAFEFHFTNDGGADTLVVEHEYGETVSGDRLRIVVRGALPESADGSYRWTGAELDGESPVDGGSSVTLDPSTVGGNSSLDLDSAIVSVTWVATEGDTSTTVGQWTGWGPGAPSADAVGGVDGSAASSNTKKLVFDATANWSVTVGEFSIETAGNLSAFSSVSASGREVKISNDGAIGHADAPSGYPTDGTVFALNSTASIGGGTTAKIQVGKFPESIDVYGFTDAASADVSVTLEFTDGSSATFHFAADVS